MSEQAAKGASVIRQWVSVGGTSCDMRVGSGALNLLGSILKGSVGRPHLCALVVEEGVSESTRELVRRQLVDAGFKVCAASLPAGADARTLEQAGMLASQLLEAGITNDDLVCAVGGADVLSAASYVVGSWCGGTPLALVPTTLDACVECGTTPRGIDVQDTPEMIVVRPSAKHIIADLDLIDCTPTSDEAVLMRALMATSVLVDNEKAVERLWDRAELLAAGDAEALATQLADTVKSRGHVVAATAVALRQSIHFGQTFMNALSGLLGEGYRRGQLLAEGVRFQSRIAAGMELLSVDDVLTIDELLDLLELEPIRCDLTGEALVAALKQERFRRSGRFMLDLPRAIGRVRLSSVDDALLLEHASAWCDAHAS